MGDGSARWPGLRGSVAISASQAISLALGAIGIFVVARALGPSGRGGLSLLQATSALVATICMLGTPTLIVRRHLLGAARRAVTPAVGVACTAAFLVALAVGVMFFAASPDTLSEGAVTQFAFLAAAVNAAVLVGREGFAAGLQSDQRFHRLAGWRIVWAAAPLAAILATIPWQLGASTIFAAIVAANVIMTAILAPALRSYAGRARRLSRRIRLAPRRVLSDSRSLTGTALAHPDVRAAFGSHVALTLLLLVYRADVLLLGAFSTATAVGLYSIAYVLAELPWLIANGYAVTLLPRLSAKGNHDNADVYRRALLQSMIAAVLVIALLAAVGRPLITTLLGPSFEESYMLFLLLAPGVVAFIPFKLLATRLIAVGVPWRLTYVCGALVSVNVLLNVLLNPRYGASGCAVAASITYVLAASFYVPLHRQAAAAEGRF